MFEIFVALAMMVVSYAISAAMQPSPQRAVAGSLDVPTADEGGNISVVFGTVMIKDCNVIYYGDPKTTAIKSDGGKK